MNPEPSAQPLQGRRHFLSCAALALSAASLARGQSAFASSSNPEIEKAINETQAKETKSRAKQMTRYLKPLIAKYGTGVLEDLKANTIDGTKSRFEKMKLAKRDLSAVKELLWDKLEPAKYQIEKLEDTPTSLKYRVHTCPWAEAYREAKGDEIGFAVSCCWDFGFCQGLNPAIKFTRTKTLMQGDDCCNHSYELPQT